MTANRFSTRLGAILTMIGVAVGLGNVWRFPYMMGSYGGSSFLLIYLFFTLLFAFPALMSEMMLGKRSGGGTILAFESIFGHRIGKWIGFLLIGVVTVAGSYYAVVVGNVVYTTWFSLSEGFDLESISHYQHHLSWGPLQFHYALGLVAAALLVIYLGIKKGIERISKWIMPFFLVSILYIIVFTLTQDGAIEQLTIFLTPDFGAMGADEIFAALGQSFFSLGLGGTFIVVYAGFLQPDQSITKTALLTSLGDMGSSLLVSLFLIPAILLFGLDLAAGPGLIFGTLPQLFAAMPNGRLIGSLFMISLSLLAFLSLIAAYQVPMTSLMRKFPSLSRNRLIPGIGLVQVILVIPSSFRPQIIGTLDMVFGSGMQVLGSLLVILGVWWSHNAAKDIASAFPAIKNEALQKFIIIWLRWVTPITLIAVLLGYIYSNVF